MTKERSPLRAVLVDPRDDRRNLMRHLVEGDRTRNVVVGEADSHDAAVSVVRDQHPDVAIVDIRMPVAEGLRTVRDLRGSFPELGIVVCSFDLDSATVQDALAGGAQACLAKPASRPALQDALDGARPGGREPPRPMALAGTAPPEGHPPD